MAPPARQPLPPPRAAPPERVRCRPGRLQRMGPKMPPFAKHPNRPSQPPARSRAARDGGCQAPLRAWSLGLSSLNRSAPPAPRPSRLPAPRPPPVPAAARLHAVSATQAKMSAAAPPLSSSAAPVSASCCSLSGPLWRRPLAARYAGAADWALPPAASLWRPRRHVEPAAAASCLCGGYPVPRPAADAAAPEAAA